jgi:hypothetical protein
MSTEIRGNVTITLNFGGVMAEILSRSVLGQNKAGERLLALAIDLAPEDVGTPGLIGSGQVVLAEQPGDDTLVVFDTPYAARLHEHPEYNFATDKNPNAQGKYLESAALQNMTELAAVIAREIRTETGN